MGAPANTAVRPAASRGQATGGLLAELNGPIETLHEEADPRKKYASFPEWADLGRAPYGLYGVKYIDLVSLNCLP